VPSVRLRPAGPRLEPCDRILVLAGLAALILAAWVHLARLGPGMAQMGEAMLMPQMRPWGAAEFALRFAQWAVMMVAMMLPSAAPMVLGLAAILRPRLRPARAHAQAALFVAAYLAVWVAFGALATAAQWGLQRTALSASPPLGGTLLVVAGLYQWTPLKNACLSHCRSPFGFFLAHWREGGWGALAMGARHGVYCAGCCWLLMALMLLAGAMNLLWMGTLAAFVLIEKAAPGGAWMGRVAGLLLAGWGVWLALGGLL
jgi:predicted metal-binding membrane protein